MERGALDTSASRLLFPKTFDNVGTEDDVSPSPLSFSLLGI